MYTEESVKSGHIGPTRENEKWMTENKMERCNPTRREKYWIASERRDGQGDMEKEDHHSYRRPNSSRPRPT